MIGKNILVTILTAGSLTVGVVLLHYENSETKLQEFERNNVYLLSELRGNGTISPDYPVRDMENGGGAIPLPHFSGHSAQSTADLEFPDMTPTVDVSSPFTGNYQAVNGGGGSSAALETYGSYPIASNQQSFGSRHSAGSGGGGGGMSGMSFGIAASGTRRSSVAGGGGGAGGVSPIGSGARMLAAESPDLSTMAETNGLVDPGRGNAVLNTIPVAKGIPFLLLLALAYAVYVWLEIRSQKRGASRGRISSTRRKKSEAGSE